MEHSHTRLAHFIKFLEKNGLVQPDIKGIGDAPTSNRFKIQKYVFLAQRMGLSKYLFPYWYGIYHTGPYSQSLGDDYYFLLAGKDGKVKYLDADASDVEKVFDSDRFLQVVADKSDKWLEIATTLIERSPFCTDEADLVRRIKNFKDEPEPGYTKRVFGELKEMSLI